MGLLTLVEDRPTPAAVYNWRVYACAAVASFAACTIGYDSAFIGTTLALPSFVKEFGFKSLSKEELALVKANIVSVYQAGAFFGSLIAYATNYFWGRKRSIFAFTLVFIAGAGMMLGANHDRGYGLIIGGRVLAGLGIGGLSMIIPIYISELAPPAIRGRLVGLYELGWQIGGLVGFWINYGLQRTLPPTHKQWIIPFAVQLIPAGILFFGAFWLKESPRYLMSKGKRQEALKSLCWIRNLPADDLYIVEEVGLITASMEEFQQVNSGFLGPFKTVWRSKSVQWRLILGGLLFMWQNGSGINAINYYSPTVFASIGISGTNTSFLTTGIFGVVKTCGTLIWLFFLIDKLGRRNLLLGGALGGSLCMWWIGGYIKVAGADSGHKSDSLDGGGIATIFFFYLWTIFYTCAWNGTPWVLNSEIHDMEIRNVGQAWAAANNWLWNFLISRFTPQMFVSMGFGVYMFFASVMLLSIPFVYFLVPETRSVPLESMDRLFKIKPVRKANEILLEQLREEEENFQGQVKEAGLTTVDTKDNFTYTEKV